MTAILPAPTYVLARAAWIPTLVIWHADGHFTRLEGEPCVQTMRRRWPLAGGCGRHKLPRYDGVRLPSKGRFR